MKLAEYLTNSFAREGIISEEDKEIVQFGLESLLGNLLGIVLILAIGICFGHIRDAILLWIFWFFLRKNAGGFHAETKARCLLISTIVLISSFVIFIILKHTIMFYVICALFFGGIIYFTAPVDNLSKRLDLIEHKIYQRTSRIILGVEEVMFLIALYFKIDIIMNSVVMALSIVGISLLLGSVKRTR